MATERELILLGLENDLLILRALVCLNEDAGHPKIVEKCRNRIAGLGTILEAAEAELKEADAKTLTG